MPLNLRNVDRIVALSVVPVGDPQVAPPSNCSLEQQNQAIRPLGQAVLEGKSLIVVIQTQIGDYPTFG